MGTVSEILRSKKPGVWSIAPDRTVRDALQTMAEKDVGALVVMDGDRLVGIVSERDYARKVVLAGRTSRDTMVREVMSTHVLCASPERSVEECMALMTDKRVRHLPILEHKRVIGMVSIGDLVKAIIREQKFVIEQLQQYITG
jgi:CBS domain-containing protein